MISMSEFKKSSYSANGSCVEVCQLPDGTVALRDSKDTSLQPFHFTPDEWSAFLAGVRDGEFDLSCSAREHVASGIATRVFASTTEDVLVIKTSETGRSQTAVAAQPASG